MILCTDHGHYLGEKDIFGKPGVPHYEPLGHTPLMIAWPGVAHRRTPALTTNVDIYATIADIFGVTSEHRTHGHSMVPLVTGTAQHIRDWALAGVYGRWVHVIDGARKYARAPVNADNLPLSMWSNRWSTMPVHGDARSQAAAPEPQRVSRLHAGLRRAGDPPTVQARRRVAVLVARHRARANITAIDLDNDPSETENRLGSHDEADMIELLRVALKTIEAPAEQFERLGIA